MKKMLWGFIVFCIFPAYGQEQPQFEVIIHSQFSAIFQHGFETASGQYSVIEPIDWDIELTFQTCQQYQKAHQKLNKEKFTSLDGSHYASLGIDQSIYQPFIKVSDKITKQIDQDYNIQDFQNVLEQIKPSTLYHFIIVELKELAPDFAYFQLEQARKNTIDQLIIDRKKPKSNTLSTVEKGYYKELLEMFIQIQDRAVQKVGGTYDDLLKEYQNTYGKMIYEMQNELFDQMLLLIKSDILNDCEDYFDLKKL